MKIPHRYERFETSSNILKLYNFGNLWFNTKPISPKRLSCALRKMYIQNRSKDWVFVRVTLCLKRKMSQMFWTMKTMTLNVCGIVFHFCVRSLGEDPTQKQMRVTSSPRRIKQWPQETEKYPASNCTKTPTLPHLHSRSRTLNKKFLTPTPNQMLVHIMLCLCN